MYGVISVHYTRNPKRGRTMFLLSIKAGLRAKEIAGLTWSMVTDAVGAVTDALTLPDDATKGKSGRTVYMHPDLKEALETLHAVSPDPRPDWPVLYSMRNQGLSDRAVALWFLRLYRDLGMEGCSSHFGRRTFITRGSCPVIISAPPGLGSGATHESTRYDPSTPKPLLGSDDEHRYRL
ncbi:MAG: hypothetical protein ETSY1_09320 [Candidatus Entotheonella factor]|uniref:Tyr recombinase domain-containing protein n=1 Tax=Entotheonella factor TaxID=1429438 RepID=W4LSL8_ENTF1|nr:MAG: hypothetical protein ETSY1_09320 [Candidatus Entotheonella factor]